MTDHETRFTDHLRNLLSLRPGAALDLGMLAELGTVSKQLWDTDPQRGGAQAIYWWVEERNKAQQGSAGSPGSGLSARLTRLFGGNRDDHQRLSKPEAALIAAVGYMEASRMASSREERLEWMQKALVEVTVAKEAAVGGADVLHVRLAHTLGPLGKPVR